jgi:hypothetical protein
VVELNPVGGLAFDSVYQATTPSMKPAKGFEFSDSKQSAGIQSVAIHGKYIVISLTKAPTGTGKRIRYAYTSKGQANSAAENSARGNVRDNDSALGYYTHEPLYNWLVHFDKPVTAASIVWGCMDSAYAGFDDSATAHEQDSCGILKGTGIGRRSHGGVSAGTPSAFTVVGNIGGELRVGVKAAGNYQVSVRTLDGRVKAAFDGQGEREFAWKPPAPGLYVVRLRTAGRTFSRPAVILP